MSEYTNYAQFNVFTATCRVMNTKIVESKGQEFLAVTLVTTAVKDGAEFTVSFTNSNGLMALQRKGGLPNGREVTVTGHISGISEVYQKDGQTLLRKRPEIKLTGAQILDGGLGRSPKSEAMPSTTNQVVTMAPVKEPTVDKTPTLEDIAF